MMEKKNMTAVIRRCLHGDAMAQEELVLAAQQRVYYHCRKMVKDADRALDLTQDVLIDMLTGLDRLQNPDLFWTWLGGITANKCRNAMNRGPRELQIPEDEDGNSLLDAYETLDQQTVPETVLDNAETRRMVAALVDALPDAQRQCVLLFYYEEFSVRQIANCLNIPENTVKSRLNYARKSIKEGVERYEKDGVKLYSVSVLPLLLYFLGRDAEATALAPAQAAALARQVVGHAGAAAGSAAGSAAAGKGLLGGLAAKIAAGAVAAAVVICGVGLALRERPAPVPDEPVIEQPREDLPEETPPQADPIPEPEPEPVPEPAPEPEPEIETPLPGADLIPMAYVAPPEWVDLPCDQLGSYFNVPYDTVDTAEKAAYRSFFYKTNNGEPRLAYYVSSENDQLLSLTLYDAGLWLQHPIGWLEIRTVDTLASVAEKLGLADVPSEANPVVCHMYEDGVGLCGYEFVPADENTCPLQVVYHDRGGVERTERFYFITNGDPICIFSYGVEFPEG